MRTHNTVSLNAFLSSVMWDLTCPADPTPSDLCLFPFSIGVGGNVQVNWLSDTSLIGLCE